MEKIIKTSELIYLNEAAKALKQKSFQILNNAIIGVDNVDSCISYVEIDTDIFYNPSLTGLILYSRDLSAFIKSIMLESNFILEGDRDKSIYTIKTMNDTLSFIAGYNILNPYSVNPASRLNFAKNDISLRIPICDEECITSKLENLFLLHRGDGCIYYNHMNKYYITLFSGLLPLNKSDQIYLTIFPNDSHTFIAKFKVRKKKFNVFIYVAYLYV